MTRDRFIRPLHRQRGRHRTTRVLDQEELAARFGVTADALASRLDELGWRYHRDSTGRIWATDQSGPGA